jgi:hypothetical protein
MSTKILDAVLKGAPPVLKGYTIFTEAFQLMIKQRGALIKDAWNTLTTLANRGLGDAYGAYCEIYRNIGVLEAQAKEANEAQAAFLKFHASKKETRAEFFSKLKEELLKKQPDISDDWLNALDALGQGNIKNNFILESLKNREVKSPEMINSAIEATVALAVRSMMALTHAAFMRHYKKISKYPFVVHKDELTEISESEVGDFEEVLENAIKQLYENIEAKSSIQSSCRQIRQIVEQSLPSFGRLQATIRLYVESLKTDGTETLSEKAGKVAARAGDLTRFAIAAYAASYYLEMNSKVPSNNPKIKKVLEPASSVKYDTKFPKGKSVQISNIENAADGDFVQVTGFVESIKIRKEGDKLLSQITLMDPSTSAKVEAVGVFVHFIHVGLQDGAYCILNGIWQSQSDINKNKPAIEIDKLNIGDLSKKSWKILFLDLADDFYDRWPGGCNISYGLSRHVSKIVDGEESKILGAGELIFKPFIRNN